MKMKMKKYLITGALALVACATLTSCHSDDELSGSLVQQKIKAYEQVFEEEFGKVDPNQDWGFGTADLLARTRTANAGRTRAFNDYVNTLMNKSGENTNKNEWGDPNKFNLQVPPQLTPGQKERVRKYFQTHTPLTYVDPHYTNFYIQQVYKGGTSPSDNPIMGNLTEEKYIMANANPSGDSYEKTVGSEHMDKLTVGLDANGNALHHVNDFNKGDWNNGSTIWVLDEGADANQHKDYYVPGVTHEDQITLMLNSNTQKVGYANSTGSIQHNYACALVDPLAIDTWAREVYESTGVLIGEDVYYNILNEDGTVKIDNQRWQRSFVGLDYEGNDPYLYENGYKVAAKVGDVKNTVKFAKYTTNGTTKYYLLDDIKTNTLKIQFGLNSEVYLLAGNKSQYAGTPSHLSGQDALLSKGEYKDNIIAGLKVNDYTDEQIADIQDFNNQMDVLDLNVIKDKIDAKCAPVYDKGLVEWVCDFENRGRDYIYSDWIVTLTKAVEQGTIVIPIEPGSQTSDYTQDLYYKKETLDEAGSGRVFCEDLGVVRASDIDFNDVVFDVRIYKTEYLTRHMKSTDNVTWTLDYEETTQEPTYNGDVWILAGGGTLPITLEINNGNERKNWSLKETFESGLSNSVIVNTIEDDEGRYGNVYRNDIEPQKLNEEPLAISSVAEVKIYVTYGKEFAELVAYKGAAPHKICVPLGTLWLKEREEISHGYPNFTNYVKNKDAQGNSLTVGPGLIDNPNTEEGGKIGDGDQNPDHHWTYWTEGVLADWTPTTESSKNLYQEISYTPRVEDTDWVKYDESDVTGGGSGTNSGYRQGEDVLVRRRH